MARPGASRIRRAAIALAASAIVVGVAASPAAAATEFGSGCDPDFGGGASSAMALQLDRVTPPTPLETTGPGVVTAWKVQSAPFLETRTMQLKVIRQTGGDYEVVAESAPEQVLGQADNRFPTRIPVAAGAIFGVSSSKSFPMC